MTTGGLAERLRQMRIERGLTQIDVAEPAYSPAYISTIEAGRRNPSEAALKHFADKLGVSVAELATGLPAFSEPEALLEMQRGWKALYKGDYAGAKKAFAAVEKAARRTGNGEFRARSLVGKARCEERQGQTADALRLFTEALSLFESESSLPKRVEAIAGIARCEQASGNTRLAAHVLETYLLELDRFPDPEALMRTYASLVWPYVDLGLHDKASDIAARALQLQTQVEAPEEIAGMHVNVARVLLNDGNHADALDSLRRAEDIYRDLSWKTEIARAQVGRAMILVSQGDLDRARTELESAIAVFDQVGFAREAGRALTELARVTRLAGDADGARAHARRAIELLSDMELVPELAVAHRELGSTLGRDQAVRHLRKAIELYRACGRLLEAADMHRLLAEQLEPEQACAEYKAGLELVAEHVGSRT